MAPPVWTEDLRNRIEELLGEYRTALHDSLDGLSEEEARARLVPSATTLLGLVKHATFVEATWFDQAVTGRSWAELGVARSVDASFDLDDADTIESVRAAYRERWAASQRTMASLPFAAEIDGRGPRPVWAVHLQVLRELAQHAGHADILREQVLARRS